MSELIRVGDAQSQILNQVSRGPSESVSLSQSLARTLRENLVSHQDSPRFDKALMDGYAVRTADLTDETVTLNVLERVTAGESGEHSLGPAQAVQIMTGAPIPAGCDAVIPVEMSECKPGESFVRLQTAGIHPEKNLIRRAAVLQQGQVLLAAGKVIRSAEIALLAEMGQSEVEVSAKPKVSILATGDELVPVGKPLGPGQIRNSNAPMLASQVELAGGRANPPGIGRDELEELRQKVISGLEGDFLLLSGGVSAGEKDFVPQVLQECGVREIFHKVRIKPGKPVWFGVQEKSDGAKTYVFGLPGNPVSSMLCFEVFVKPALRQFLGQSPALASPVHLPLAQAHVARGDRPTYYPAQISSHPTGMSVKTVDWKGSSDLFAPTRANAWILFPAGDREYLVGDVVEVLIPDWSTNL